MGASSISSLARSIDRIAGRCAARSALRCAVLWPLAGLLHLPSKMAMMMGEDFQYVLRILNTNVDGRQKVMYAMCSIKGIGRRLSCLICKKADIDLNKRAGELTNDEVDRIITIVQNPRQFKIPDWFLNRQKDNKDGKYSQVRSTHRTSAPRSPPPPPQPPPERLFSRPRRFPAVFGLGRVDSAVAVKWGQLASVPGGAGVLVGGGGRQTGRCQRSPAQRSPARRATAPRGGGEGRGMRRGACTRCPMPWIVDVVSALADLAAVVFPFGARCSQTVWTSRSVRTLTGSGKSGPTVVSVTTGACACVVSTRRPPAAAVRLSESPRRRVVKKTQTRGLSSRSLASGKYKRIPTLAHVCAKAQSLLRCPQSSSGAFGWRRASNAHSRH